MRQLGVGLVYWTALASICEAGEAAVVELEPQTLWTKTAVQSGFAYRLNEDLFERIVQLPQRKLMHGVGQPFGGTADDPVDALRLLRRMADRLDPAWVSEHLSFNRVWRNHRVEEAGFLLPPPQHAAAIRVAAANIRRYAQGLARPVAFETGVNYLRPADGHMSDGAYFRAVAEEADCGILLDVHNLWCNERNGRQRARDVLAQMPLERVWEVHFAGGMLLDGFWLDGHSGAIPAEVVDIAADLMPKLPNVGALVFEILPEHLHDLGLDGVHRQLETLDKLWRSRPARTIEVRAPRVNGHPIMPAEADIVETRAWETAMIDALSGEGVAPLTHDPGIGILQRLVRDLRSASLTRALKLTMTGLIATQGIDQTRLVLNAYFRSTPPEPFAALDAHRFAGYLRRCPEVSQWPPYLCEVLAFEAALIAASAFGETTEVRWSVDPTLLLAELEAGRLPGACPFVESRMVIAP